MSSTFDPQKTTFEKLYAAKSEPFGYSERGVELLRHSWVVEHVRMREPANVLEIGCSQGLFTSLLAAEGWEVTALDLSTAAVTRARKYAGKSASWIAASALALPVRPAHFDTVLAIDGPFSWYLSEAERVRVYQQMAECVAPDGSLIISEYLRPNRFNLFVREIKLAGLHVTGVHYLHDRLWYKLEGMMPKRFAASMSLAKKICAASRLLGLRTAHHILVVANPG